MEAKARFVSALLVIAQDVLDARNIYGFDKRFDVRTAKAESTGKNRANFSKDSRHVDFSVTLALTLAFILVVKLELDPGLSTGVRFIIRVVIAVCAAQIAHQQTGVQLLH